MKYLSDERQELIIVAVITLVKHVNINPLLIINRNQPIYKTASKLSRKERGWRKRGFSLYFKCGNLSSILVEQKSDCLAEERVAVWYDRPAFDTICGLIKR